MKAKTFEASWLPAEQAAKVLHTTHLKVLMLIKRGLLCGRDIDGTWQVSMASLEAFCRQEPNDRAVIKGTCGGCSACG
ncbi:MAG: hypothetical protein C0617_00245 [Desulfuromonas sp.]|uniref:hypothetical protein n=1 Tax=Desulfuromonas sp. TaxID=892 RepID=UPI000CBD3737|nr:hypothetical protein [Desulfuromonas sp.]PLX86676.1 MAG: hypothetical protein C0617_00245 [Desulfuromonas sp.]